MRVLLKPIWLIGLIGYFLYDLWRSSIEVAWDVLTPTDRSRPKMILLPLDAKTDAEIMATANLISLTPGTLTIDVSEDRKFLLIHAMFGAIDAEATKAGLKRGTERRVLRVLR
ncbi:Na+/H+ antiporter subunit E [Roseobacter sp. HKCCA0434]|uniref:Na+/H+ antiporter subunit E n=1 Tax=Roseobacter sp. HKCCA0434 TaxID=3079297 RepID=UPI002905A431|nr:Na+/H+ antiporter subunit E [Roseobacter sp. HKCCA0434]